MNTEASSSPSRTRGGFPATHWSQLLRLKQADTAERVALMDHQIWRYWKPVYYFLRRKGSAKEEEADMAQNFFAMCHEENVFAKADPAQRFRNLLLGALARFAAKAHRFQNAQKRRPAGGFVTIHELATADGQPVVMPVEHETPEGIFHLTWISELLWRVLKNLEQEYLASGKAVHFEIFRQRVIAPIFEGATPPPLVELAQSHGLTEKDVGNRLLTTRRAYQRLLREEVGLYATSEAETKAEIADILHFLTKA